MTTPAGDSLTVAACAVAGTVAATAAIARGRSRCLGMSPGSRRRLAATSGGTPDLHPEPFRLEAYAGAEEPWMPSSPEPQEGRAAELARLDRVLDGLIAGRPGIVALTGEPGIGKTRLLTELARRADSRNCLALEGRSLEFERALPFAV